MLLNTDYFEPAELTGYARAALADREVNRFQLSQWLPSKTVDDLEYRYTKGANELIEAATYRAFDAESEIAARPGLTRVTGELPPVSRKIRLGEYDRLRQRANPDQAIRANLLTDTEHMTRAVAARIELARGQALVEGKVDLNENRLRATVDFGRSPSHSVTAAASWAIPTTDILGDLIAWCQAYVDSTGETPGAMLTSSTVVGNMLRNEGFRESVSTMAGTPTRVSRDNLDGTLASHQLPSIYTYDARIKVGGVSKRVIPADVVLFLPAPTADAEGTDLGATLWGTTAESLDPRYAVEEAPGIVAGVYGDDDPPSIWTKAAAISLPVLVNPDMSFKADVMP